MEYFTDCQRYFVVSEGIIFLIAYGKKVCLHLIYSIAINKTWLVY